MIALQQEQEVLQETEMQNDRQPSPPASPPPPPVPSRASKPRLSVSPDIAPGRQSSLRTGASRPSLPAVSVTRPSFSTLQHQRSSFQQRAASSTLQRAAGAQTFRGSLVPANSMMAGAKRISHFEARKRAYGLVDDYDPFLADEEHFNAIPLNSPGESEIPYGCMHLNRFKNILPNRHSRVLLSPSFDPETGVAILFSDYINANYIRKYDEA